MSVEFRGFVALMLMLIGGSVCCGPAKAPLPGPTPPPVVAECEPVCARFGALQEKGDPDCGDLVRSPDGKPCIEWCSYYAAHQKIDLACMASAATCRASDDCGR
jgi:hypothetical protein